jgi:hypothetical protein
MPIITGLGKLRQEDLEFKARCYIARPCFKKIIWDGYVLS